MTVFADGEVDRSPCGSGTSARLAVLHDRGELAIGQLFRHRSIVDIGVRRLDRRGRSEVGRDPSVVTEVEGIGLPDRRASFALDPRDPLETGFLLR